MRLFEKEKEYEVVVAGGGLSGVAAAVAAGRMGKDVLLIEEMPFLGGMATAGLVNPWMRYHVDCRDGAREDIITGVFKEMNDRLEGYGAFQRPVFHPHWLKIVLTDMVNDVGVALLTHTVVAGVEHDGKRVEALQLYAGGWKGFVEGRFFIDATGDADVAANAGFETEFGRKGDGAVQPCTLSFRVARVDMGRYEKWRAEEKEKGKGTGFELLKKAREEGRLHCPRDNLLIFKTPWQDVLHFNQTRILGVDARDPVSMTEAYHKALGYIKEYMAILKAEVPGFEKAELQEIAAALGVRESRRIVGEYMLTEDDVVKCRKFDDGIVRANYSIDIHNPTGAGTVIKHLPPDDNYEVPYRSLIPKGGMNLLVAGRPIGATHEAHSSLRVMPICTGIGQAAGVAAAIALDKDVYPQEVPADELRQKLTEQGQNLGRP